MGRKSSAKALVRESSSGSSTTGSTTPPKSPRSSTALTVAAIIALVAVVGGYTLVTTSRGAAPAAAGHSAHGDQSTAAKTGGAPGARWGPHKQASLPPLPTQPYAPPRPPDVVRAAYLFAAEHPEILSYVPCFCGCERGGHSGNHDCFVAARDAKGDGTPGDPHAPECNVCL